MQSARGARGYFIMGRREKKKQEEEEEEMIKIIVFGELSLM
jgi:hypothetical protein